MVALFSPYAKFKTSDGPKNHKNAMRGTTYYHAATANNIKDTKTKAKTCSNACQNELGHTFPHQVPDGQYKKYMALRVGGPKN